MQLKKLFAALAVSGGLVFTLAGCGDKAPAEKTAAPAQTAAVELKIGVSPVPHADIINFVAPTLEKEGVKVKVIEFNDYVQPNLALSEKELDANFFQHKPYLDTFSKEHKLNLAVLTAVHLEPMGVYSKSIKNVADLPHAARHCQRRGAPWGRAPKGHPVCRAGAAHRLRAPAHRRAGWEGQGGILFIG